MITFDSYEAIAVFALARAAVTGEDVAALQATILADGGIWYGTVDS